MGATAKKSTYRATSEPRLTLVRTPRLNVIKAVLLSVAFFLAFKLPICFSQSHPEEFRDFEAYRLTAQGELPYKDYAWQYGPLSPLIFGPVLKVFPTTLLSLRLAGLLLWALGAAYVARMLCFFCRSYGSVVFGTLFATGLFAYPNYTYNHIPTAVALIASAYYFVAYLNDGALRWIRGSFLSVLICLASRPVLTGYGATFAWILCFYAMVPKHERREIRPQLLFLFALFLVGFTSLYGSSLILGYLTPASMIMPWKPYPNLHHLVPHTVSTNLLESLLKNFRSGGETLVFYLHHFIWPAVAITWAKVSKDRSLRTTAGGLLMFMAIFSSADLLHYGHPDPESAQFTMARGQFFLALTFISMFVMLVPVITDRAKQWWERGLPAALLAAVFAWSYLPWGVTLKQSATFATNPYGFKELRGLASHPDRSVSFDAIQFLNTLCTEADEVAITQYDPWATSLLRCHDIYGRDSHMFQRRFDAQLVEQESPYYTRGGIRSDDLIYQMLADIEPQFYFAAKGTHYAKKCEEAGWRYKDFGTETDGRRVCWRADDSSVKSF